MTVRNTLAMFALAIGCTSATPGGTPTPPPDADASNPARPDVSPPVTDASADLPENPEAPPATPDATATQPDAPPPVDAPAVDRGAPADGPKPWPPPGTDYLTKLETESDYNRLATASNARSVAFIIRRRANDDAYPYPWDRHDCVFEVGVLHLEFLQKMDSERALRLYFVDAKSETGSLIPGRLELDKTKTPAVMRVTVENFQGGLMSPPARFPLDAATRSHIRERIQRCVPFTTNLTFSMWCSNGSNPDCPL